MIYYCELCLRWTMFRPRPWIGQRRVDFRTSSPAFKEVSCPLKASKQKESREREARDASESLIGEDDESGDDGLEAHEAVNGIYRVLKNNEIMGQILRNKHGSIYRKTIEEFIEIMADGGLRL